MNEKVFLVVAWVGKLIVAKGHVAHCQIEAVVGKVHTLKSVHRDVGFGVKLLGDPARDGVQLHTVKRGVLHLLRQKSKEVAHTHGRLQHGFWL